MLRYGVRSLLLAGVLTLTQCAEPLTEEWTEVGPCRAQVGCGHNGGATWLGNYWERGGEDPVDIIDNFSNPNELSVAIGPQGGEGFVVYKQKEGAGPGSVNSVLRLELKTVPNPATQAQFLFGVGSEYERLLFEITAGELLTRRDLGVLEDGEVITGPYEFTSKPVEHAFDAQHVTLWLEIQEEDGLVRFRVGNTEDDLREVYSRSTPDGLRDPSSRATILVGRWSDDDEVQNPGTVVLGTFCHCPLP